MWAYAGVLLALFLVSTNLTVIGTALPRIIAELEGFHLYTWAFTAFTLASTITTPIYGRLSDSIGRKPVLLFGVLLFSAASVAAGFSTSMTMLIALRALQGIGGGALLSMTFVVIADIFPPKSRSRYQGYTGLVWGASSVIGPLLGGLITDLLGWRWVFFVNVPFALLALTVLKRHLPSAPRQAGAPLDLTSIALLSLGMLTTMLALGAWGEGARLDGAAGAALAAGVALLLAFAAWQTKSPRPLIPPGLMLERTVALTNVAAFMIAIGLFAATVYLPLYIQGVAGLSAAASGFALAPLLFGMIVSGSISGVLVSRSGRYRRFIVGGLIVATAGYALAASFTPATPIAWVALGMVVLGLGLGPTNAMFLVAAQAAAPPSLLGTVTSSNQFFRQVGGTLGVALFGALMIQQATLTFEHDVRPLLEGLPSEVLASVRTPELLTDPQLAREAATLFEQHGAEGAFVATLAAWRAGIGRGIAWVYLWSAALSALALLAAALLPARQLSDSATREHDPGEARSPQLRPPEPPL